MLNIAEEKMYNKFIAKSLLVITLFSSAISLFAPKIRASATSASTMYVSASEKKIKVAKKFEKVADVFQIFTKQQAIEDLNYVFEAVSQYHVACTNGLPEEVLKQREIEIQNLPEGVTTLKLWKAISRILNKMNDAHTSVGKPNFSGIKRLPFDVESNGNSFICTSGKFKGAKILSINNVTITELYEKHKSQCSYEIEEWANYRFFHKIANFISSVKLMLLDIDTSNPVKIEFQTKEGIKSESFEFVDIDTKNIEKKPFVSYKIDKEKNVAIFTLNECNYDDVYRKTVDEFFAEVSRNSIKNIVVDLRANQGGNSEVCNYFGIYIKNISKIKTIGVDVRNGSKIESYPVQEKDISSYKMDKNMFSGDIYVATSNGTFSSARIFAVMFLDNNVGTLVGETPGNSPTAYGDVVQFQTPNSKLAFQSSTKKWYRPDSSKNPEKLIPDVKVHAKDAITKIYEIIDEKENFISNSRF